MRLLTTRSKALSLVSVRLPEMRMNSTRATYATVPTISTRRSAIHVSKNIGDPWRAEKCPDQAAAPSLRKGLRISIGGNPTMS